MRYTIEKKFLSFADRFFIKDESGQVIYEAVGKILSIGAKISILDLDQRERAFIQQKAALTYTYQIFTDGELAGTLNRPILSLGHKYTLQLPEGPVIEARGSVQGKGAELTMDGASLGRIFRPSIWRNVYAVELGDESKTLVILAMVIGIALVIRSEQSSASSAASAASAAAV